MVVAAFLLMDKANQVRFFEATFLVANVSLEIVLGMLFLNLSGADVNFLDQEPKWRIYTTKEALSTTRRIGLLEKKEFVATALDLEYETLIIHIMSLSSTSLDADIHLFYRPKISGLIVEDALTKVSNQYVNFVDVFSPDLVFKLPKHTRINDYAIKLVDS